MFTGNRADYGPLLPLLRALNAAPEVELQVLVAGAHLAPGQRESLNQIRRDGFTVATTVEMLVDSDSAAGITKSLALGMIGFADALPALAPDIAVVLGDRYETVATALACLLADIPVAHVGGGEVTDGVVDESLRHAITKMSHLHFVAAEPFRRRLLQLGEDPARVWTVGALGVDSLATVRLLDRAELERELQLQLRPPAVLLTYHPVVRAAMPPEHAVREVLRGLNEALPTATVLITRPNVDAGSAPVLAALEAFTRERADRVRMFTTLGQLRYLSALQHVDIVVGNSSSGIIEAPAVGTPTVNVGSRQRGRPRAASVIDCAEEAGAVAAAVRTALSAEFRQAMAEVPSPYGPGGAARRIASTLATVPLEDTLVKRFHDLPGEPAAAPR